MNFVFKNEEVCIENEEFRISNGECLQGVERKWALDDQVIVIADD